MNKSFKDLGLSSNVLSSIERLGYANPSKIQEEIIPLIIQKYDVIGQAQTGTGKTLAYAASILSMLDIHTDVIKAIILTPTRELALQVSEELKSLNKSKYLNILPVYGGSSIDHQLKNLKKGVDIVVGTPGRIMDLINRKALNLEALEFFILDEADEMLNMGFQEDIEFIFKKTKKEKQVLLFSATMPKEILRIAKRYMKVDYQHIAIEEVSKTSINVTQNYYLVNDKIRNEALCRIIDAREPKLAIIFCQTKRDVDNLLTEMSKRGFSVEAMHGDIAQSIRLQTLERFKSGSFHYLIATDVAARGIHVDNIDCVINYHLPQDVESYIHRVGRTGRASNKGVAISLVDRKEVRFLKEIEKVAKCKINQCELPELDNILESKYKKIINQVNEIIANKEHEGSLEYVRDMNKSELTNFASGLLKALLNKEIGSDFSKKIVIKDVEYYDSDSTRVFLTIGKMDNLKKGTLLDFLKKTTNIDKNCFKNIEILTKFTFMNVDNDVVDKLISKLYNKKLNNRIIRVEKAKKR